MPAVIANLLVVAAGVAVPTGMTAIYAWKAGLNSYLPEVVRQIHLYTSSTPLDVSTLFFKLMIAVLLLGYPIGIRVCGTRISGSTVKPERRIFAIFIVAWLLAETAGIVAQERMYLYHFLPLACPAALLYGLFPRTERATVLAVSFVPFMFLSLHWDGSDLAAIPGALGPSPVARYLASHTVAGDSVFADRVARVLIETGLQPGCRYGIIYYWANYDAAAIDYWHTMHQDFEQRKPKYIIVRADADQTFDQITHGLILSVRPVRRENCQIAWKEFREYLASHYQQETSIDGDNIYRRREGANLATIQ